MRRIILSLIVVVGVVSGLTLGATGAFFSDIETSTGNTFGAGEIDLKIDNESYYNGVANASTTWSLTDLTIERFFDFHDLKPGDYGEDTISLHVDTNDAYMCALVTLTSNDENGINEPEEKAGDITEDEGELAGLVNFLWWADDGDNVLENDEEVISQGPIGALGLNQPFTVPLADSDENIWTGVGGPVPGDGTLYIGKAWCFGDIAANPLPQSDYDSPADDNNGNQTAGEPEDGGISCSGAGLGNISQTDSLTADVSFDAVQARHNPEFQCESGECEVDTETDQTTNGGFETPEVDTAQQWDIFDSIAGGWTVEWRDAGTDTFGEQNRPEVAHLELHEGVLGDAFEGDQYAELDTDWGGPADSGTGEPASVRIYQDIPTTPGVTYELSFAFAPRPSTPSSDNHLEVRWGGDVVHDTGTVVGPAGPINWSVVNVEVLATTTTTRLEFTDLGESNSLGTFLDDVSLVGLRCELPQID